MTGLRAVIPRPLLAAIGEEAERAFPEECCGLLLGLVDGCEEGAFHVLRIVPSPNVTSEDPRTSFEIDPALRLRLERAAREGGDRVIGHYHSHPNGRVGPSARDLARVYEPALLWLVAAVEGGRCGAITAHRAAADGQGFGDVEIAAEG